MVLSIEIASNLKFLPFKNFFKTENNYKSYIMSENENETNSKSLVIFGRDVSKIPCFRNTYLYGILGGFGSGLAFFLFTSRVKASTDVAVGSFVLISLAYWVQCRYNYGKTKYEMMRLQEALIKKNLYEGTELGKRVEAGEPVEKFDV